MYFMLLILILLYIVNYCKAQQSYYNDDNSRSAYRLKQMFIATLLLSAIVLDFEQLHYLAFV